MIYANILTGGNYKCRNVMPVLGMKVIAQQFTQGSLAFHVISKVRSLTLFAQNEGEKQEWVEVGLNCVICMHTCMYVCTCQHTYYIQ